MDKDTKKWKQTILDEPLPPHMLLKQQIKW